MTGLHLHGLNKNTRAFATAPPAAVLAFAKEFGFIETALLTLNTVEEVKKFTNDVGETGTWRGEAVEGFVVRCKVAASSDPSSTRVASTSKNAQWNPNSESLSPPPYPPGSDFFFKIKFDEPYLMYRAWREITKIILTHHALTPARKLEKPLSIPKARLARAENKVYKEWVQGEIERVPGDFEGFQKGHGIIEIRERFLKYLETEEGKKRLEKEGGATKIGDINAEAAAGTSTEAVERESVPKDGKVVIVPIAVPGCGTCSSRWNLGRGRICGLCSQYFVLSAFYHLGKTAVAVGLVHLFGFAHTQSDDVKGKKTSPTFQRNITELLKKNDVVIADR